MSDLRDECIEAIDRESMWNNARGEVVDAVLRVVGDALMGDEAVQAAWGEIHGDAVVIHDTVVCALSAAWRVVTGSNAAVSGGDEGNTP